eukprot:TRINITY_DN15677_c0_g1_i1.p1 TRINITY_DN15677_c0_g1~~TRINITY_DN15677_c0_g1_i1.p1  ORF type:complete len:293 (-),score=34.64 TRINITY_DN15677_c0_g1_i1:86-964(-)
MVSTSSIAELSDAVSQQPTKRQKIGCGLVAGYSSSDSDEEACSVHDSGKTGNGGSEKILGVNVHELGKAAEAARDFQQQVDSKAIAHGSRVYGLADEDSDLDVLSSLSLLHILSKVRSGGCGFRLVQHLASTKVPRLLLRHKKTGMLLDVVEASRDPYATEKDQFLVQKLRSSRVQALARSVKEWYKVSMDSLPREEGFPSAYGVLLSAVWYLDQASHHAGGSAEACNDTKGDLEGWIDFLHKSTSTPRKFCWTREKEAIAESLASSAGRRHWLLVDPVSGSAEQKSTSVSQ